MPSSSSDSSPRSLRKIEDERRAPKSTGEGVASPRPCASAEQTLRTRVVTRRNNRNILALCESEPMAARARASRRHGSEGEVCV